MKQFLVLAGLVAAVGAWALTTGGVQVEKNGLIELPLAGETVQKRYVLRYPEQPENWNGRLVIGAHGGTGGERFDIEGKVIGTDETALDDVVGDYTVGRNFAYASVDRDGIGATRDGLALTYAFTERMRERIRDDLGRAATHTYLVGLSMGGGITRFAAEDSKRVYDGVLIIAGAGGDIPTRLERQAALAVLWPEVDPRIHSGLEERDEMVQAYAEAAGTPFAARAFWPYTGDGASLAGLRRSLEQYNLTGLSDAELRRFRFEDHSGNETFQKAVRDANTTGRVAVPTIEVVGTYDDLVIREIRAYREKVESVSASDRHRLYQVEGVWHISGDDDAIQSFAFIAKKRGLGDAIQQAMKEAASYVPTVQEALGYLDRWVTNGVSPPPSQTVQPGQALRP